MNTFLRTFSKASNSNPFAVFMFFCCIALTTSLPVNAAIDAYPFPNAELRERYNALIDELRCPQCLNTNLAGSDAMIAKDLRREVHRLVLEGKTDEEVLTYMFERYGDFILYNPKIKPGTFLLWFGPFVLFLIALFVGYRMSTARQISSGISDDEQARLDQLINARLSDK